MFCDFFQFFSLVLSSGSLNHSSKSEQVSAHKCSHFTEHSDSDLSLTALGREGSVGLKTCKNLASVEMRLQWNFRAMYTCYVSVMPGPIDWQTNSSKFYEVVAKVGFRFMSNCSKCTSTNSLNKIMDKKIYIHAVKQKDKKERGNHCPDLFSKIQSPITTKTMILSTTSVHGLLLLCHTTAKYLRLGLVFVERKKKS